MGNVPKNRSKLLILSLTYLRWAKDAEPDFASGYWRRLADDFRAGVIGAGSAADALWQQRSLGQDNGPDPAIRPTVSIDKAQIGMVKRWASSRCDG